ncbi:MAG: hypothetical protein AAFX99_22130, partial [Myxococcota bacterium]
KEEKDNNSNPTQEAHHNPDRHEDTPKRTDDPAQVAAERLNTLVRQTSSLLEQRRWNDVVNTIDQALPRVPEVHRAGLQAMRSQAIEEQRFQTHLEQGRKALAEERHKDALDHFEQIPDDPQLSVYAAEVARDKLRERTRAAELNLFKQHLGNAIGLYRSGRYQLAIIHVRKALKMRPNHGTARALERKLKTTIARNTQVGSP